MGVSIPVIFGFYKYPNWCYPEHSGTYDVHYHLLGKYTKLPSPRQQPEPLRRFHTPYGTESCNAMPILAAVVVQAAVPWA